MATVTFFHQERADGGVRSGIDYEGMTVLENFIGGAREDDASLVWYIDVKFEGNLIPIGSAELVRSWLHKMGEHIKPGLMSLAADLEAGTDTFVPVKRDIDVPIPTIRVTVAATGIRRLGARQIGEKIRGVAEHWQLLLQQLRPLESVT